jgi:transcriptional regulator with XRE-family HTH domain
MAAKRSVLHESSQSVQIGPRIRASRLAKGLTLEQVAKSAGLTEGFVSKLERDQVSASVASLVGVCQAIGLRVGDLFEPPTTNIVRSGEGSLVNFGGEKVHERLLTPGHQSHIEVLHSVIEAGGSGGKELYSLNCEVEFVFVIEGSIEIQLGPESIILAKGDALTFKGQEPHTWRNASSSKGCQVVWVMAPATI